MLKYSLIMLILQTLCSRGRQQGGTGGAGGGGLADTRGWASPHFVIWLSLRGPNVADGLADGVLAVWYIKDFATKRWRTPAARMRDLGELGVGGRNSKKWKRRALHNTRTVHKSRLAQHAQQTSSDRVTGSPSRSTGWCETTVCTTMYSKLNY